MANTSKFEAAGLSVAVHLVQKHRLASGLQTTQLASLTGSTEAANKVFGRCTIEHAVIAPRQAIIRYAAQQVYHGHSVRLSIVLVQIAEIWHLDFEPGYVVRWTRCLLNISR